MIINPFRAWTLAAQAERANEALADLNFVGVTSLDAKVRCILRRELASRSLAAGMLEENDGLALDLAEANAKLNRMLGNLKRGPNKAPVSVGVES